MYICSVFIDLKMAFSFDIINHGILVSKLNYGIREVRSDCFSCIPKPL